jgi:hypothetical protein
LETDMERLAAVTLYILAHVMGWIDWLFGGL